MAEREDLILNPVPFAERIGWKPPLFNILGCNIALSELMVGGVLITGLTFKRLVLVSLLGNLILCVILAVQGNIATREGLNTYVLVKQAFGEVGGKWIISTLLGITSFGWFGVQAGVAGLSVQKIFPNIDLTVAIIVLGILMVIVAVYGFNTMALFNYIAIPPLLILMIWGLYKTIGGVGFETILNYTPTQNISIIEGINIVVGLVIVGVVISPDYLRYTRGMRDVLIIGFFGISIISFFQQVAAGAMATQTPTWDITLVLAKLGFNWVAFIILLLAAWSTNLSNAYSGGLALKTIFPNVQRKILTLVAGLIGTAIAACGIVFKFQGFLSFLSMLVPAVAGVMWVEYYIIQKKKFIIRESVNWLAMIAWIAGSALSFWSSKVGVGLPPLNGIVASSLIYFVLVKTFDKSIVVKEASL
ncbi:cytosine permease [Aminobacterium mobile]|uniref:cytosine permease n=1 Tax=Aminobacterium mobile TaxID=81467 RepID=UPI00331451A3